MTGVKPVKSIQWIELSAERAELGRGAIQIYRSVRKSKSQPSGVCVTLLWYSAA